MNLFLRNMLNRKITFPLQYIRTFISIFFIIIGTCMSIKSYNYKYDCEGEDLTMFLIGDTIIGAANLIVSLFYYSLMLFPHQTFNMYLTRVTVTRCDVIGKFFTVIWEISCIWTLCIMKDCNLNNFKEIYIYTWIATCVSLLSLIILTLLHVNDYAWNLFGYNEDNDINVPEQLTFKNGKLYDRKENFIQDIDK